MILCIGEVQTWLEISRNSWYKSLSVVKCNHLFAIQVDQITKSVACFVYRNFLDATFEDSCIVTLQKHPQQARIFNMIYNFFLRIHYIIVIINVISYYFSNGSSTLVDVKMKELEMCATFCFMNAIVLFKIDLCFIFVHKLCDNLSAVKSWNI